MEVLKLEQDGFDMHDIHMIFAFILHREFGHHHIHSLLDKPSHYKLDKKDAFFIDIQN